MNFPGLAPLLPWKEAIVDIPAEEFLSVDGQQVHVVQSGQGPPLILLHGIAASHHSFRDLVQHLTDRFFTVAIDLNGFGYTERPQSREAYRIEAQADLIIQVLDSLRLEKVDLCGHSYGAAVAAMVAQRHPDRVLRVVLISPAAKFERAPWYLRNWLGLRMAYWLTRGLLSDSGRFQKVISRSFHRDGVLTESLAEHYRSSMLIEGFHAAFFGYAKALGGSGHPPVDYAGVEQKSLLLGGQDDPIVKPDLCRELADLMNEAQLFLLSDCGHSAPEEYPEKVALLISDFLTE